MKNIKKYSWQIFLGILMLGLFSCKKNDGYRDPISTDETKPPMVTNIKVTNYNGGSYITYDLPKSDNLLYVIGTYDIRNGVKRETKSSYFNDTLKVEGFAKAQDYQVTLYSVSRAEVKSDPITVTVHPNTPVFQLVGATTNITSDFGGVNVKASNPLKRDIGVIIVAYDQTTKMMEVQDQHYTNQAVIDYSIRGYNTDARDFGVYITDKYGNISDTLKRNISPLFEMQLDKSKFGALNLASNTEIGYGWNIPYLWDNKIDEYSNGWHTNPGHTPPYVCSFGIGGSFRLSRFILYERPTLQYSYLTGGPSDFAIWGTNVASPGDAALPATAAVGAVVGDWVNLSNYHFPDPPSGLPIHFTNAADDAFIRAGVNFNVPIAAPAVRYLRIAVSKTWGQTDYANLMEITLYGKPE